MQPNQRQFEAILKNIEGLGSSAYGTARKDISSLAKTLVNALKQFRGMKSNQPGTGKGDPNLGIGKPAMPNSSMGKPDLPPPPQGPQGIGKPMPGIAGSKPSMPSASGGKPFGGNVSPSAGTKPGPTTSINWNNFQQVGWDANGEPLWISKFGDPPMTIQQIANQNGITEPPTFRWDLNGRPYIYTPETKPVYKPGQTVPVQPKPPAWYQPGSPLNGRNDPLLSKPIPINQVPVPEFPKATPMTSLPQAPAPVEQNMLNTQTTQQQPTSAINTDTTTSLQPTSDTTQAQSNVIQNMIQPDTTQLQSPTTDTTNTIMNQPISAVRRYRNIA